MIYDIIAFIIIIGISIFLNKRYILNRIGKIILKIISWYINIIYFIFFLDKYNIPSLLKYNIDYQMWLNIIINCINTFVFGFAILLFMDAFKVSLNNNKELKEKYKISFKLLSFTPRLLQSTFLLQISAKKDFNIYAYGFNDILYKNDVITKKGKKINFELKKSFLRNLSIDLYLDFGVEKCKLSIDILKKNKQIITKFYNTEFDFD